MDMVESRMYLRILRDRKDSVMDKRDTYSNTLHCSSEYSAVFVDLAVNTQGISGLEVLLAVKVVAPTVEV